MNQLQMIPSIIPFINDEVVCIRDGPSITQCFPTHPGVAGDLPKSTSFHFQFAIDAFVSCLVVFNCFDQMHAAGRDSFNYAYVGDPRSTDYYNRLVTIFCLVFAYVLYKLIQALLFY